MVSEWFYAEVLLEAGATAPLDADHEERAIYVTEGEVDIAGDKFEAPQLLIFRPGDRITVTAVKPSRLMFLGGAALEGPRYLWWNFVSSRKERIEEAKQEWKTGRFAIIPGDDERIYPAAGELIRRALRADRAPGAAGSRCRQHCEQNGNV